MDHFKYQILKQNPQEDLLLSLNMLSDCATKLENFYKHQTISKREASARNMGWPVFEFKGKIAQHYWEKIAIYFPEYQLLLADSNQNVKAIGQSIPIYWDGNLENLGGWDDAIRLGCEQKDTGITPNTLIPLAITIRFDQQRKGYSMKLLEQMKAISRKKKLKYMMAPVRPMLKSLYPTIAMEKYIRWKNKSGGFFDPWIRIHARLGAKIVKIAPKSLSISGTVEEWEKWANMSFPESGNYVVPEALSTIRINREKNYGIYYQPNVWMQHKL